MKHNLWNLIVATEDDKAKKELETEIVIYSKVGEPARLDECKSKEDHVQLETTFENGTRCRVRKVIKDNKSEFFFTFKVPTKTENGSGIDANTEFTVEVDESFFNGFMSVASRKLVKTRYNFTSENVTLQVKAAGEDKSIVIPNIEYEVDIYTKADGTVSQWCKIDVEVDNIIEYIHNNHPEIGDIRLNVKVSHLPFAPTSSILAFNPTDEQRISIDKIWEEFTQVIETGDNVTEQPPKEGAT
jgi:hypothetical protein